MELKYVKVFLDNLGAVETLSDAECGKLFVAILRYGRDQTKPKLKGEARLLFPLFQQQIDKEREEMEMTSKLRSAAGRIGGIKSQRNRAEARARQLERLEAEAEQLKQMQQTKATESK